MYEVHSRLIRLDECPLLGAYVILLVLSWAGSCSVGLWKLGVSFQISFTVKKKIIGLLLCFVVRVNFICHCGLTFKNTGISRCMCQETSRDMTKQQNEGAPAKTQISLGIQPV